MSKSAKIPAPISRVQVKAAADSLGRLEALEDAYSDASEIPHGAVPISFPSMTDGDFRETGTKAYYPITLYKEVLDAMITREHEILDNLGVEW